MCSTSLKVAFLTAYLPPKVTQKGSVRRTYSKVIAQIGYLTCQVLSFANLKEDRAKAPRAIIKSITTLRTKVGKASARKVMIKWGKSCGALSLRVDADLHLGADRAESAWSVARGAL